MDDEFKLCWKNFQDNIASGFQNLYDRGDLVDVTLACDGKLLHAHKIVLAICSPYFQEIFLTNPCKHPIIILKDVHFNIMCELLEFMYQGVVNVKHTELQSFMKIGQLLQIKGLATNSSAAPTIPEKSMNKKTTQAEFVSNLCSDSVNSHNASNEMNSNDMPNNSANNASTSAKSSTFSPASSPTPVTNQHSKNSPDITPLHAFESNSNLKRHLEGNPDVQSIYSKKHFRRSGSHTEQITDQNYENDEALDHVNPEDFFLSAIPHISMVESRYELNNVKREGDHVDTSATSSSMRNSFGSSFGFEYNLYKNSSCPNIGADFSNEINIPNDYSKNFGNHMDIPPSSSSVTMLSTTSLLHGNCVFNRNNTVATQQGMKTYWLCKSYRISMCRARCITHQGRVISATGVHNHPPHMRKAASISGGTNFTEGTQIIPSVPATTLACNISGNIIPSTTHQAGSNNINNTSGGCLSNLRSSQAPLHMFQQNQPTQHPLSVSPTLLYSSSLHPHPNLMIQPHSSVPANSNSINSQPLIVSHHGCQSSLPVVSQSQNSVIQNSMLNVNMLQHPAVGHVSTPHSPYIRDTSVQAQISNSNLVITPVTPESPKQIEHSPSKTSKHSKHELSIQSASNCVTLKPHGVHSCNEGSCSSDLTRALENNIAVSPSDMRINPKISDVRSGLDVPTNSESRSIRTPERTHDERTLQISSDRGHNFKIENM